MTYKETVTLGDAHLLPALSALYGLQGHAFRLIPAHEGGRNAVYRCEREGAATRMLRIAFLPDRSHADFLAETEYIRYLAAHGGGVADVLPSRSGSLVEAVTHGGHTFYACLFEAARGQALADNHYRYREGVPLDEYFFQCGKTLGKLHQLSKEYTPTHRRYAFFDKYNTAYLQSLLPGSLSLLRERCSALLKSLADLDRGREAYGMVHFDYGDGNYRIDYDDGRITVFDFDNACHCWYLFDLASVWRNGVGWVQFEPDAAKRRRFMDAHFDTVLRGYRSETRLDDAMLERLPLFVQAVVLENIVDAFEVMKSNGEAPACDEELSYLAKCLEDDIPYLGFFHAVYNSDAPFAYTERRL